MTEQMVLEIEKCHSMIPYLSDEALNHLSFIVWAEIADRSRRDEEGELRREYDN